MPIEEIALGFQFKMSLAFLFICIN